jgi:hypothetical protein
MKQLTLVLATWNRSSRVTAILLSELPTAAMLRQRVPAKLPAMAQDGRNHHPPVERFAALCPVPGNGPYIRML